MEEKFIAAWQKAIEEAAALGVRQRPLPDSPMIHAHRVLSSHRESDGFAALAQKGRLELSLEALAIKKQFTSLFSDEEANNALTRLLDAGYSFQ
ncbi:MAG: hypothetical protein J6A74_04355 [Oscillospiraceae bacterium]|nr:hypothetical protein [Oscillospiraceae bacterium]